MLELEIIGYGNHYVFQNEANTVHRKNIYRPGLPMDVFIF